MFLTANFAEPFRFKLEAQIWPSKHVTNFITQTLYKRLVFAVLTTDQTCAKIERSLELYYWMDLHSIDMGKNIL